MPRTATAPYAAAPGAPALDMSQLTPQQAFITQSFQSQVYIQNQMDVQDEPIYDTISFITAAAVNNTTASWFAIPLNNPIYTAATQNKTLAQTNVSRANTLIAPEAQTIFQYRIWINENIDPRDLFALFGAKLADGSQTTGFCFQFFMGTKAYQTGPIYNYAAGGGIHFQGTAAGQSFLQNGIPAARMASEALSVNLVIENEESFYGYLIGGPTYTVLGANGISLKLQLMGLHARPIR